MQVVLPFHAGDAQQAADLLLWVEQLGGAQSHDAILMVDGGLGWDVAVDFLTLANKIFRHVNIISLQESVTGWPRGANALFLRAAEHCAGLNEPFLWLEPDCVPLSKDWLDRIQSAYSDGFLGHIYECNSPGLPRKLLSGVAVYPPNAYEIIHPRVGNQPHLAWDVSAAEAILPTAKDSHLFHHFWGNKDLPPTFSVRKTQESPTNTLTLDHLRKGAAIFHRNKDGTLRRLVADKLGITPLTNFVVVLPVCNHDADLMSRLLDWIAALGQSNTHEALVSYDNTTIRGTVTRIISKASACFSVVHQTHYSVPKGTQFPQTAAWQHAARTMAGMNRPWLWMEADCVPLKPHWLQALQDEYDRCGKPFCGPLLVVGHCNGTAIYPSDTPGRLPRTMSHTNNAWDVECKDEMGANCYGSKLWCLAWGVTNGKLDPMAGSELPSFTKGSPLLRQIPHDAAIFHRDKTGSLIERLREGKNV
jgi:hypothetical protein